MKKIIVVIMLLLPLGIVAQELKIAFVNARDVFNLMPEANQMELELAALNTKNRAFLTGLNDELEQKTNDFYSQQDTLTENIKNMLYQDIIGIQTRIENFRQSAEQEYEATYEKLYMPILEKLTNAIDQVGDENGYTFIINPEALLYKSKTSIDATDKVKAKLGIQ